MNQAVVSDSTIGGSLHKIQESKTRSTMWLLPGIALLLIFAAALVGLSAIDAGISYYVGASNPAVAARRVAVMEAAKAGKALETPGQILEHSGSTVALMGTVTSTRHAYGKDSLMDHLQVFSKMSKGDAAVLLVHSLMGGICMIFGGLQFWPAFRRRHPRWHRRLGYIYLILVQGSMILGMVRLLRTPVDDILDQLFFYVGLWGLAIGVSLSLWMAMFALWRRKIALHQAWMCIGYGLLLSTPIQRYGWLLFGMMAPGITQAESDYAVTGVLIPLALIVGYCVFTVNRWGQSVRKSKTASSMAGETAEPSRLARNLAVSCLAALFGLAAITVQFFTITPGLEQAFHAQTLIPVGVIQLYDTVITHQDAVRWLFVAATLTGLTAGSNLLWTAFVRPQSAGVLGAGSWALAGAGAVVGCVLVYWGVHLGMPSYATLAGGSMHVVGGTIVLLLSALLAFGLRRGEICWVKEWGLFVLACIAATPCFYFMLPAFGAAGFDPKYVQAGHIFRLALSGQWLVPILCVFVYSAYGQATQSRIVR